MRMTKTTRVLREMKKNLCSLIFEVLFSKYLIKLLSRGTKRRKRMQYNELSLTVYFTYGIFPQIQSSLFLKRFIPVNM